MGRPATDYKLVVRPWESGIRPCIISSIVYTYICACVHAFTVIRTNLIWWCVLSRTLPGCPTGGFGGGSKERVWWQVVWYEALSSEHWSAESSQDGQEEER